MIEPELSAEDGKISVYRFHSDVTLSIHCFDGADINWLHFVATNRDNELFPDLLRQLKETDIVGGKIADDNTRRTLFDYETGIWLEGPDYLLDIFEEFQRTENEV